MMAHPTVEAVAEALTRALRGGLHARVLKREAELLRLAPPSADNQMDEWWAALWVEQQVADILMGMGNNRRGDAARELFGLALHARGLRLGERRTIASISLNITERSLVRSWEQDIVWDVAVELYRRSVIELSLDMTENDLR